MTLTHSQKKYLKKNLKRISLEQIANNLKISEDKLFQYLKSQWGKEKYQKFVSQLKKSEDSESKVLVTNFNFKNYFIKNWKVFAFLAFLVLVVYFNSLGNDFVSDDIAGIKENPNINNINYFLNPPYFNITLGSLINFLTHKIFGLNPAFYRLTNILFHLGSVIIIYLLSGLFFKAPIPLLTAGIFATHPILTEGVTWIAGGSYSASAFFILLSLLAYILFISRKRWKTYLLSVISFILALLFSGKSIFFPIILILYELSFRKLKDNWRKLIPFLILGGFWTLFQISSIGSRVTGLETIYYQKPGLDNPLIQIPVAVASYIRLIFWPDNLTLYHSELNFTQGQYFLMVIITLAFFAFIAWSFKKNRQIFFWSSFFIITLLPFLTPLRISWVVAERYVYLGSLGIIVLIALALNKIGELLKNKKITWIIFSLLILALATRTVVRNFDWKNQDTLWLATAKTSPSSHQNHNNLGDMYARHGDYQKAIEEFQKAIELKPDYGDAYHNLANIYHQVGQDNLAEENYQKALSLNPNLWQSYQNLAAIFFGQEKFELSKQELEKAIKINPENTDLYTNVGIIYLKLNENQKAKEAFEKALQIEPQNQKAQQQLELIK